ncbi:MAG: nucleotidyltransferase domain-containing protein [Deltaproteobacteria bacterium]|nr:nucleotidyltransferase domain-containing protein [Deltaproteobacteria bacterium]MBW2099294.1 nucleotidyltransferase domain-containing protein [Deltaproteobacteria bacterium]
MATEQVFELNSKKRIIINHLKQLPGLMAVFVHGSVAKGTEHPGSDLDLALLFHHDYSVSTLQLLMISGELESLLGRPVHIGLLSMDNVVFAREVIESGRLIYSKDQIYCDTFIMYALSFYADLNRQRKSVLDAYLKKQ